MIVKEKALEIAKRYCENNGLSPEKLEDQYTQFISDKLIFVSFPPEKPDGLKNDLETQGIPTLLVCDGYSVVETEYTRLYLGMQ